MCPPNKGTTMITVTAFAWVPPLAEGLVRDLRVRWALEEAGLAYQERLIARGEQDTPAYRAVQPFGQVPVFEEDGLTLFESGAIVLHIGERSEALLPKDTFARAGRAVGIRGIEQHRAVRAEPRVD
jgi:glutathione S-transferase